MGKSFKITNYPSLKAEKKRIKAELEQDAPVINEQFLAIRNLVKSKDFKFFLAARLFPEYFDGSTLVPKSLKASFAIAKDLISGKMTVKNILGTLLKNAVPLVPTFLSKFRKR